MPVPALGHTEPVNSPPPEDDQSFREELEHAAIEAEFATGDKETTEAAAKAHVAIRVARMTGGFLLTILGIVLLPLPGPGGLIIAAGLAVLAQDIAWADRALRYVRKKTPGIPEDGKIPRATLLRMLLISAAFIAVSLWWTLR